MLGVGSCGRAEIVPAPGPADAVWLALVVLAACAPSILLAVGRLGAPADGTATYPSAPAWGDGVVVAEVFGQAGDLRPGDQVVSVDGVALDTWVSDPPTADFWIGQVLEYGVRRGDTGEVSTVEVVLRRYPLARFAVAHAVLHPLLIGLFAVAAFVFLRCPADPAARALFRLATLVPLGVTAFPYSTQVIDLMTGRLWPLVVSDIASLLMWGALLHFTLVFPRPRGPVARHPGSAAALAYSVPAIAYAVNLAYTLPEASGALERVGRLVTISVPAANTVPMLAAAAMIASYLTARDAATRQRLLWVFVTIAFGFLTYLGLGRLPERYTGSPFVPWDWLALAFLPVPIAVAAAVLRYRLFDVEVFLRRSLVYGVLVGTLGLIYLGAAAALARLFGTPLEIGPMLAGAVIVVLVLSLRERLRRVVMRLIFGDRDDPYEVVRRLGQRLEATASADSVLRSVVETLAQALRLAVRGGGADRPGTAHRQSRPAFRPAAHDPADPPRRGGRPVGAGHRSGPGAVRSGRPPPARRSGPPGGDDGAQSPVDRAAATIAGARRHGAGGGTAPPAPGHPRWTGPRAGVGGHAPRTGAGAAAHRSGRGPGGPGRTRPYSAAGAG